MKPGDLVRFEQTGQLIHHIGDYPEQEKYWTIGLCLSYDKVQGKITYVGKEYVKQLKKNAHAS